MSEAYTVEDLNPRSKVVKDMEMSLRRAIALERLCERHMQLCSQYGIDPERQAPVMWGSIDKKPGGPENPATLVKEVGEVEVRSHWHILYRAWHTGSLRRQIDDGIATLPSSARGSKHFKAYVK